MNPFDLRSILLARHAQHVVLIHFPIALEYVSPEKRYPAGWFPYPDAADPRMKQARVDPDTDSSYTILGIINMQIQELEIAGTLCVPAYCFQGWRHLVRVCHNYCYLPRTMRSMSRFTSRSAIASRLS